MRLLSTLCGGGGGGDRGGIRAVTRGCGLMRVLFILAAALSCCGACPDQCMCSSQTVKCQSQDLEAIPQDLPANTKFLFVTGNYISRIDVDSFPTPLEQLTDLYLSGNEMEAVGAMAFHNLPSLVRLDLSNNRLENFSSTAFPNDSKVQVLNISKCFHNYTMVDAGLSFLRAGGLPQLAVLDLSNNDLVLLPGDILAGLPNLASLSLQNSSVVSVQNGTLRAPPLLRELDLRDNSLQDLPAATLAEISLKPGLRVRLAGNPWWCTCLIEDMLAWLKNSTQVADAQNLTCAEPERLRRRPLLQVEPSQLKCSGDLESVLETSYVFLGLVLALIGVIFLLVLYLNRKGIKRWMYNIRDACRDHMEGYHYRYEINSDPRLANLSINSDV